MFPLPAPPRAFCPDPLPAGVTCNLGPHAATWWTLPHIAALGVLAVIVGVVAGLCLALSRDNLRASRAARR